MEGTSLLCSLQPFHVLVLARLFFHVSWFLIVEDSFPVFPFVHSEFYPARSRLVPYQSQYHLYDYSCRVNQKERELY